jgi:hypothetical protein
VTNGNVKVRLQAIGGRSTAIVIGGGLTSERKGERRENILVGI